MAGMREGAGVRTAALISQLLKIGLAIAMIAIIAHQLSHYTLANGQEYSCLLGSDHYSLCVYGYVVAFFSLLASLALALLAVMAVLGACLMPCLTCGMCRFMWGELALSIFGFSWWVIAGAILTHHSYRSDRHGFPQRRWRHAVFAICWVEALIFLIMAIVYASASRNKQRQEQYSPQPAIGLQQAAYPPVQPAMMA